MTRSIEGKRNESEPVMARSATQAATPTSAASVKDPASQEVKTRLILNFPGFEHTDSEAQIGRLNHGAQQTGKIWGFSVAQDELHENAEAFHTLTGFNAAGPNWQVKSKLVQFRWNDIVDAYEKDTFPAGFLKNLGKFSAFFFDGTVRKYRKASWRYWGFTIFPLLLMIFFAALTWLALWFAGAPWWLHVIGIPLATLLLCKWPGDRLYVPLTIADWGFARDMVLRSNQEIEARFESFGQTVREQISASDEDEIIIVGHSFGSLWAVAGLANALRSDPDLLKGKKVTFLALGSSMLKIALAKEAGFMRDNWQLVMNQPELFWHEVQTKDDLIAFYKCDPFEQVGITDPKAEYAISRIRFSKGMEKKRYKQMRKSFYRTHRQYILYYDKRVPFDYMLRLMGPLSTRTLALVEEAHRQIGPEGSLG